MTLAVVPVLVGPLQTLLALLPAILVAIGTLLAALLTPRGMLRTARFFWHQKLFTLTVLALGACAYTGWPLRVFSGHGRVAGQLVSGGEGHWPMFRGGPQRTGVFEVPLTSPAGEDWSASDPDAPESVYASPAVAGQQLIFATAGGIGPFSPAGRGAIVSVDTTTGGTLWRYAPDDFRATFSSPVVTDGLVVCGEGLHLVHDARVTCLDLNGNRRWEFRTKSHVEATVCIDQGRVYVAAGDDGFYCLSLTEMDGDQPRVLWHLDGRDYPDCESSPVVADGAVYFGLGEGGQAMCAVDAATGAPKWRVETPYPVFAAATVFTSADGASHLAIGMGRGNFVQSAVDLREQKLSELKSQGASESELAETHEQFAPAGEIWCLDPTTGATQWKYLLADTVLGAIAARDGTLYFGSRDGYVHALTERGQLRHHWTAHEPIVSSPAATDEHLFVTTLSGRLYCLRSATLEPLWDVATGSGAPSFSSPTFAFDRVFVGTADQGIRCVRATRRVDPPLWTSGRVGGVVAGEPLPERGAVAWRADPVIEGDEPREVQPLAAVPGCVLSALAIPWANESVVTAWHATPVEPATGRAAWQKEFEGRVVLPPLIVGPAAVIGLVDTAEPTPAIVIVALDRLDGNELWRIAATCEEPIAWTADHERIYLLADNAVQAWRVADGRRVWRRATSGDGVGAIAVADDFVLSLSGNQLTTLDALTGTPLREPLNIGPRTPLAEGALAVLTAKHDLLHFTYRDDEAVVVATHRAIDGQCIDLSRRPTSLTYINPMGERFDYPPLSDDRRWIGARPGALVVVEGPTAEPMPAVDAPSSSGARHDDTTPETWCSLEESDAPATPLIAVGGRVYFLTDWGRLVCVAGQQP